MPSYSRCKCYFGCEIYGSLYRFPQPKFPHYNKFLQWKMILHKDIQTQDDTYIYNQIRLCSRHFEDYYVSASGRLIQNAIPTLNIGSDEKLNLKTIQTSLNQVSTFADQVYPVTRPKSKVKMNPKIEVDHELFTTCRLCLDRKGNCIILPDIQKNIKYAYDIEIQLNNKLPQLICVNCKSIMGKYVCTKQMYQEKQKTLQSIPQSTKNASIGKTHNINNESRNIDIPTNNDHSETFDSENNDKNVRNNKRTLETLETVAVSERGNSWRNNFTEYFACKFCSKTYIKKISVIKHIQEHKTLLLKYKNITTPCFVKLEKTDQKPNITGSKKFVMFNVNKIIQYRTKYYYKVYQPEKKSSCIAFSNEDDNIFHSKSKRRRFILSSESLENTVEQKDNENETNVQSSTIEFPKSVTDFDSQCTKYAMKPESKDKTTITKSNSIIEHMNECYNIFLANILNESCFTDSRNLQDSFLSMERKKLNTSRLNCPALLSSFESKNLDVILNTDSQKDSKIVRMQTKLRGKQYLKKNTWPRLNNASNIDTNLINTFSKALNCETNNEGKSINTSNVLLTKLLNASPVAYPRQLSKKNFVECNNIIKSLIVNSDNNIGEQDKTKLGNMVKQNDVTIKSNVISRSTIANSIKEPSTHPRLRVKDIDKLR